MGLAGGAWLAGCAATSPFDEARGAGAGYWPANSRAAVQGSIEAGYRAIEVDVVLTSDLQPVLNDGPSLDPDRCTAADGSALSAPVSIPDTTLDDLHAGYLCGGNPDPGVQAAAEPLLTFDELLDLLSEAPDLRVDVDLRYTPGVTHPPEVMAAEVLGRWWAFGVPNPLVVSSDEAVAVRAIEERAAHDGHDVTSMLAWPRDRALLHELSVSAGIEGVVAAATAVGADGVSLDWRLADRDQVLAAGRAGLEVQLRTVDDEAAKAVFRHWPVESLLTDYPEVTP